MSERAASVLAGPPGWHGKLPTLGDFASRRLDAGFIEAWDGWLAAGLLALRQADAAGWLPAYLGSPSWRFLLMPGVLPGVLPGEAGAQAWAGVLMPSVDRVGRYFPLTLAQPLGDGPASTQQMQALWHWLGRLDELALDALQDDWTAERLEDELARMAGPGPMVLPAGAAGAAAAEPASAGELLELALAPGADAAVHIGVQAQRGWAERARGLAWWHAAPEALPPRLLVSRGLPAPQALGRLFGPPPAATI